MSPVQSGLLILYKPENKALRSPADPDFYLSQDSLSSVVSEYDI